MSPNATILDVIVTGNAHAPATILAATDRGIWQSDDAGITWHSRLDGQLATALALSPDRTTLLAGVLGGITLSTDAGITWVTSMLPFPDVAVTGFAFSPEFAEDDRAMLATLEDGLFVSHNRGVSWQRSTIGLFDPCLIDVIMPRPSVAWVAAESGLFASLDGGASWTDCEHPQPGGRISCLTGCGDLVMVGTAQGDVLISQDTGSTWQPSDTLSLPEPVLAMECFEAGDDRVMAVIASTSSCGVFAKQTGNWSLVWDIPLTAVPVCLAVDFTSSRALHVALVLEDGSLVVQVDGQTVRG
jgi:photosystem II stability/assembly factor-like uncharacterized protein